MYEPMDLSGAAWEERGMKASFMSARGNWGVVNRQGGVTWAISKDGVTPSVWSTKGVAQTIAESAAEMGWSWISLLPG